MNSVASLILLLDLWPMTHPGEVAGQLRRFVGAVLAARPAAARAAASAAAGISTVF